MKLRNREMETSAFAFLRGAAPVMAADLAASLTQTAGVEPAVCCDAHLANFGTYFSPERALVFDVDDFDEARPEPWDGTWPGWPRAWWWPAASTCPRARTP